MAYAPPQRYRAPNGADVILPPEVAAGFVGFEPVEAPPDPGTPSVPVPPPVDQSLLATPPLMPPPEEPTFTGAVGGLARPGLVQDVPLSPAADTALAQPTPGPGQGGADPGGALPVPPPKPTTPADLMAGGYAPVLDQQREAMALERAAGVEQIAADKRSAEEEARAIAASGERDQQREAERARIQRATLADIAQRSAAIDGEIDRIANTKIDTSIRRPAVAAIAIAMGAIGAALAGKNDGSNPALDIILKQIDASAQRQMAERDAAVRTVGLKRDQLAGLRSKLTDTNALYDGLAAAETRRIRTEMARIGAASKSDAAKANLAKLDAMLAGKEAEYLDGAKTKQFALDDREKQRAEQARANRDASARGWAGIADQRLDRAERKRQFDETMKFQREKEVNDLQIALSKVKAPDAERMKELDKEARTMAVRDPTTGKPLLSAEGQKLATEADKLEKQAEKLRASDNAAARQQAETMAARAAELRTTARLEHTIKGNTPEHAGKINATIGGTQNMLSLLDGIKAKVRDAGNKVLNQTELQAALETEMALMGLEIKDLWTLGALDKGSVEYMEQITGGDSTKLTTAGFLGALGVGSERSDKAIARMNAIGTALERKGRAALTQQGLEPGAFKFARDDAAERPESVAAVKLLDAKTPVERAEGTRKVGALRAAGDRVEQLFTGADETESERRAKVAEETNVSKKYPGLSSDQEAPMDALLAQARGNGPEAANAQRKLVEAATATAKTRPAVSNAVLNILRDQQPELYREAVEALPDEQRQMRETLAEVPRQQAAQRAAAIQGEPLYDIEQRALGGDVAATSELWRRFQTDPTSGAAAAWNRVLPTLTAKRKP